MRLAVQYQVKDPRVYLFHLIDPESVLVQVVEKRRAETIGKSTMDFVLTEGRSDIVADIKTPESAHSGQLRSGSGRARRRRRGRKRCRPDWINSRVAPVCKS